MDNQKIIHPFFIGKGSREGRKVSREGRNNAVYGQPQGIQTINFLMGRISLREKIFLFALAFFVWLLFWSSRIHQARIKNPTY